MKKPVKTIYRILWSCDILIDTISNDADRALTECELRR